MGLCCCCYGKNPDALLSYGSEEREIEFNKYISSNDDSLKIIEEKYNILIYIYLLEFTNYLETFSSNTATVPFQGKFKNLFSSKDEFLNTKINIDEFQSFLENKIFKINSVYEICGSNENLQSTFIDNFREIFKCLELKLNQNYNEKKRDRMKKKHILALGMIFCLSTNIGKIKLLFDLFADEEKKFKKSEELNEFLLTMFISASYALVNSLYKLGKNHDDINKISNDEMVKLLNASELKDNQNLLEKFNETFFEDKESLTYDEFKNKFKNKEKGFGWIFSSKGIRFMLEKYNV